MTKKSEMLDQYLSKAERAAALTQIKAMVKDRLGAAIARIAENTARAEAKKLRPEIEKEVRKQLKIMMSDRVEELVEELLQDIRVVCD